MRDGVTLLARNNQRRFGHFSPRNRFHFRRRRWQLHMVLGLLLGIPLGGPPPAGGDEVPYIQTPANVVDAMLRIAEVGPQDYVIDLGSGDGRIVIAAAKRFQARGLGIELDRWLVAESRANAVREGVSGKVQFLHQDIFLADFRAATVLTMYLLPEVNLELRPRILFELRPGTRVVSHDWDMGDWEPDRRLVIAAPDKTIGRTKESTVYLWIVPARIAGFWRGVLAGPGGDEPVVVEFNQRFQSASARVWLRRWTLAGGGHIRGDSMSLSLDRSPWMPGTKPLHFTLHLAGDRLGGEAADGNQQYALRATRVVD